MAYAQWVSIKIQARGFTAQLKNVVHKWGKFYSSSKDSEIDPGTIEGHEITNGNSYTISACGRSDSASGTEGSFDIYDSDTHIGTYSWDCPWGSKTNRSTWDRNFACDNYVVEITGANLDSGALGNVDIVCAYIS